MLNNFQLDNNPGLSEYIIIPEDEDEEIYPADDLPDDDQMIFVPLGKICRIFPCFPLPLSATCRVNSFLW